MKQIKRHVLLKLMEPVLIGLLLFWFPAEVVQSDVDSPDRSSENRMHVRFRDVVTDFPVMAVFVLPGEILPVSAWAEDRDTAFTLSAKSGRILTYQSGRWNWQAPRQPGCYPIHVRNQESDNETLLNVFVMVPANRVRNGRLNGYLIGDYPKIPFRNDPCYLPPEGFIEVTEENASAQLSPHFRLDQFVCKDGNAYPKYMVLREELLLKLERIVADENARGNGCKTLHIMSGYRTPAYNRQLGNVTYTRHIYGDAADIFIDARPEDNLMDDLNGDRATDIKDAQLLYNHIDLLFENPDLKKLTGGLGVYNKTAAHGPFVHVDTRGVRSRWGMAAH